MEKENKEKIKKMDITIIKIKKHNAAKPKINIFVYNVSVPVTLLLRESDQQVSK